MIRIDDGQLQWQRPFYRLPRLLPQERSVFKVNCLFYERQPHHPHPIKAGQARGAFRDGVGVVNTYLCDFCNFNLLTLYALPAGDLTATFPAKACLTMAVIR